MARGTENGFRYLGPRRVRVYLPWVNFLLFLAVCAGAGASLRYLLYMKGADRGEQSVTAPASLPGGAMEARDVLSAITPGAEGDSGNIFSPTRSEWLPEPLKPSPKAMPKPKPAGAKPILGKDGGKSSAGAKNAKKKTKPKKPKPKRRPRPIVLYGVTITPERKFALISNPGLKKVAKGYKRPVVVEEGEELQLNYKVKSIENDSVIFDWFGEEVRIGLYNTEAKKVVVPMSLNEAKLDIREKLGLDAEGNAPPGADETERKLAEVFREVFPGGR